MELTFKQKVIAFGVMLAIFMGSVFLKQMIQSDDTDLGAGGITTAAEMSAEDENAEDSGSDASDNADLIIVDIEGAVTYPGVVKLSSGSRVYEAVEDAGGLLETADTKYVNLAEELQDGTIIYIPYQGENGSAEGSSEEASSSGAASDSSDTGLININTADKSQLMELPGIGEAYAQAIIEYRENSGSFKNKEDIKNVSGIGDAKYEKLESMICVY